MGSVRHRLAIECPRHDCSVVLVGDSKVGKSALVNRFIHNKFSENYKATSFEKFTTSAVVANRRVKYTIWDTTGSHNSSSSRSLAYRNADVFLLCYKISDPSTLFSALNHWCPEIRAIAPATPIILVGCQSDLRTDRDVLSALSRQGRAPVSSDQALSFSQQIDSLMYVETSSKSSTRAALSAFEVAGLASLGQLSLPKTPSPKMAKKKHRYSASSPRDSLERSQENPFWDRFSNSSSPKASPRSTSESPRNPSSRSASLGSSKTQSSNSSIPSISSSVNGSKTPKSSRKSSKGGNAEKMITLKCQRLTADKTYEEVEIEVPAPIYETIQLYNINNGNNNESPGRKERKSLGSKLKNLFAKN